MADLPTDGSEPRSAKRPATAVRGLANDLDEAPAAKRSKLVVAANGTSKKEEESAVHIFWSRIFVTLRPDAIYLDRFVKPAKPSDSCPPSAELFCITVDMKTKPAVSTIKRKIQAEHGT